MDAGQLQTLTDLVDLDGFEVVGATSDRATKLRRLTVVPTGHCRCPVPGVRLRDGRPERLSRPRGGRPAARRLADGTGRAAVAVRVRGMRGRYFTPRHVALAEGAHATERFPDRLAEGATHGDASAAARFLGVAEKTAERWYYDHLERRRRRRRREPAAHLKPVGSLGIDELSLKKSTGSSPACRSTTRTGGSLTCWRAGTRRRSSRG